MRFADKRVIVTGAASGIGRAIADAFAREGAWVAYADRNGARAHEAAATERTFGIELDVTKSDDIAAAIGQITERFGGIDILLNAAGVFDSQPLLDINRKTFDAVFDVNVSGLFFVLQAVARQMIKQGRGGKIVNIASVGGRRGHESALQYSASKAAVISITQSAGLALIHDGINVNAIAPGQIRTPMWTQVEAMAHDTMGLTADQFVAAVEAAIPAGRIGTPDDLVGTVLFLTSPESDYIVGQTFNVDGGLQLN